MANKQWSYSMKYIVRLLFLSILWSGASFADGPINTSFFGGLAIDGYDTVAYWTEKKAVEGKKKFTYEYKGAKWRFSTQENLDLFKSNPVKYLPEYGGHCAYAMSDDRLVGVDPEVFEIFDGKLYLNYSKSVQGHWVKEKEKFIGEANGFYAKRKDK